MNISRKDFIGAFAAAGAIPMVSGCKTIPTTDEMHSVALAIGYAGGTVANMLKIDDKTRNIIVDILNECQQVLPAVGQTFTEAWSPIADAHIKVLVDAGTITAQEGDLIKTAFLVITKGIDLVFVRYPKAAEYKELVVAAVDGFCTGFLAVFKPVNQESLGSSVEAARKMDMEAFKTLRSIPAVDRAIKR